MRQRKIKSHQNVVGPEGVATFFHDTDMGMIESSVHIDKKEARAVLPHIKSISVITEFGHFVARNETRRGESGFWYAFKKIDGKTRKIYIGKTEDFTFKRLCEVAKKFHDLDSY
jgi:hypothetical protein